MWRKLDDGIHTAQSKKKRKKKKEKQIRNAGSLRLLRMRPSKGFWRQATSLQRQSQACHARVACVPWSLVPEFDSLQLGTFYRVCTAFLAILVNVEYVEWENIKKKSDSCHSILKKSKKKDKKSHKRKNRKGKLSDTVSSTD